MKYFLLCFLTLPVVFGSAQSDKLVLSKELFDDYSSTPIYDRLIEKEEDQIKWKPEYAYLDSIDIYLISYLSDGLKINGLLAQPKRMGNYPSIIYNRGGNRDFGALKIATGVFTMGRLAAEGYVVIASQYRGNGGSEGVEEFGGGDVNDVLILTEVLKEIERADATNIGMYGWSRGGMMTYLALTQTDKIKAAVVGGAVSDSHETIKDRPEMESGVFAELVPDYEQNKKVELDKRSAVRWADRFSPDVPILMLHGNADWRVKSSQSIRLALEFDKYRIPYRLIIFEGGDHGISEHREEVERQTVNWFNRFLKENEPIPDMDFHGR